MVVIGINTNGFGNDDEVKIQNFISQTGISFPVVQDGANGSYNAWAQGDKISPYPLDCVIGRDGIVSFVSHEYDAEVLRAAVQAAL